MKEEIKITQYFSNSINKGYFGTKLSINSQIDINNYIVPLSSINKKLIYDFLNEYTRDPALKYLNIEIWKYYSYVGLHSAHHMKDSYEWVNHYDLKKIANYLLKNKDNIHKKYLDDIKSNRVYEGYNEYPKIASCSATLKIGDKQFSENIIGIVKNGWIYGLNSLKNKYRVTAMYVSNYKVYSYDELDLAKKENYFFYDNQEQLIELKKIIYKE